MFLVLSELEGRHSCQGTIQPRQQVWAAGYLRSPLSPHSFLIQQLSLVNTFFLAPGNRAEKTKILPFTVTLCPSPRPPPPRMHPH